MTVFRDLNIAWLEVFESIWLDFGEACHIVFGMSYLEDDCRGSDDPQQVFQEHIQVMMEIDWWTKN